MTHRQVGQEIYHHFVHDRVGQAVMRARKSEPDDGGAHVFVNTTAHPDWISPDWHVEMPAAFPLRTEERRKNVRYLMEHGRATTTELVNEIGVNRSTVKRTKDALADRGWIKVVEGGGPVPDTLVWTAYE